MKTFKVDKEQKLSKFLNAKYGALMPYSTFMKLLRNKDIKINGFRVSKDVSLSVGDDVIVYFDGKKEVYKPIYSNAKILVFNKPPTITSEDFEVIINKDYIGAKLCHRLDRNTSGLLVFATDETAYTEMLSAFKKRSIDKYYKAEVYGKLSNKKGVLTSYLVKDSENSIVKIYDKEVINSTKIVTEYEVIEELSETSIVKVKLITGTTHQIRAHLAHIGHCIVGDNKYGDVEINKKLKAQRQKLTAYKIAFNFEPNSPLYSLNKEIIEI